MSQEASWFQAFTWNSERETEEVILLANNVKVAQVVKKTVEEYLESLQFKRKLSSPQRMTKTKQAWIINLTDKTFEFVTGWEAQRNGSPTCWPSHIDAHIKKYWPTIVGRKFGI